jgi:glycosyltransferase involved in cell wall biosynthesis
MRRVLVLAYHFPPIGGAAVHRTVSLVRRLPELGYEPVVVTGPGADHFWSPEDRLLVDAVGDVTAERVPGPVPTSASPREGRLDRLFDRRGRWLDWWIRGASEVGSRLAPAVDLVYGALEPYRTAEAAAAIAERSGKAWVADLQDPWAFDEMRLHPTVVHRRSDRRRMRRSLSSAAAVIMNTREAERRLREGFPEFGTKLVTAIPNGFEPADFEGEPGERDPDAFRIVHTGHLHTELGEQLRASGRRRRMLGGLYAPVDILPRSHVYLLEAIERLSQREPELVSGLEVHLVGVVSDADRRVAERSGVVRTHGQIPYAHAIDLMKSSDLLFLPMHDVGSGARAGIVPAKTYDYLAAKTPILAAVPAGDARDLLSEAGNAYICDPTDTEAMAAAIADAVERRRAGVSPPEPDPQVLRRHSRDLLARRIADVFDAVLGGSEEPQQTSSRSARPADERWPKGP